MQKAKQLARLTRLSVTGGGFGVIVALLISAAASAQAAEPILTLVSAYDRQPQEKTFMAAHGDLLSSTGDALSDFTLKGSRPEATSLQNENATVYSSDIRFEKPAHPSQRDSFQLVHENLTSSSRSNMTFSLQAGYGRIWDDQSTLQKICVGHQESSCAYVSAKFSF